MTESLSLKVESELTPFSASLCLDAHSVLVLAPHPDDEVFGCGGAIAAHRQAGISVHVVVMTDGGKAGESEQRYTESRAASQVLGYGEPVFWGLADRGVQWSEALLEKLCDVLVANAVDLLYAPSPWELHPDHRQASVLAMQGVRRLGHSGIRVAFFEVSAPLRPNLLLDITPHAEVKKRAMRCFTSQLRQQNYLDQVLALNRFRTYTLPMETEFAEAFSVHDCASLERNLANGFFNSVAVPAYAEARQTLQGKPLVSVLVRSMDRAYLMQALESVALQTYPNLEVIVVSAGPGHQELPHYCGVFPMRLVRSESALPRSKAANHALDESHGEYLLLLDDDDWLMPGHIERLASALSRSVNAPAAYTGISLADAQGKPLGQVFDMPYDGVRQLAGNLTPIHSVLFRASLVHGGCRFDEALDRYEDWDFWLQLSRHGTMVHLPGVSAIYRVHNSSGVHVDAGPLGAATQAIYQKWRVEWSTQELGAMMQRVWSFPEQEGRLEDLKRQETQLRTVVQQQTVTMAEQVSQLSALRVQAQTVTEQLNSMRMASEAKSTELQLLKDSRSWKITRPLRWLTSKLRRRNDV